MAKMIHTFYISTGALNAMYTLRHTRFLPGSGLSGASHDSYICNLSTDIEKAAEKAKDYFDRVSDRFIGDTSEAHLDTDPDCEIGQRRGKLSVKATAWIEEIEKGYFPFGKHMGTEISAAPDNYLLYFADKLGTTEDFVTEALSAACMGAALERDLIAKREAARQEIRDKNALSEYVGDVGQRLVFEGEIELSIYKDSDYGFGYYLNRVRVGTDIIVYMGSKSLGERGESVKFKATIKSHDEYQGVKSTKVSRPAII